MKIRTVVPKRYLDVLVRGDDADINIYDEGQLIEGFKFDLEYFRERISNVFIVAHTNNYAVVLNPFTKEFELFSVDNKLWIGVTDVDPSTAGIAQEVHDLLEEGLTEEEVHAQTASSRVLIGEISWNLS